MSKTRSALSLLILSLAGGDASADQKPGVSPESSAVLGYYPEPVVTSLTPGMDAYTDMFVDRRWRSTVTDLLPAEIVTRLGVKAAPHDIALNLDLSPAERAPYRDYAAGIMAVCTLRNIADRVPTSERSQRQAFVGLVAKNALTRLKELAEASDAALNAANTSDR